jgi:hypothetical protein
MSAAFGSGIAIQSIIADDNTQWLCARLSSLLEHFHRNFRHLTATPVTVPTRVTVLYEGKVRWGGRETVLKHTDQAVADESSNRDTRFIASLRKRCKDGLIDEFQQVFGGGRFTFPHPLRLTNNSPIVQAMGWAKAVSICEAALDEGLWRVELEVPVGRHRGEAFFRDERRERVSDMIRQGQSSDKIAREVGISRRTVLRIRKAVKEAEIADVIIMLKRGMALDYICAMSILSELQILKLKQQLKAKGELPLTRKKPVSTGVESKGAID